MTTKKSAAEAYIVTNERAVVLINDDGKIVEELSDKDFAMDISYDAAGNLWALTTNSGVPDRGGNVVAYFVKGKEWVEDIPGSGEEAAAISADGKGAVWIIDGEDFRIKSLSKDAHIHNAKNPPGSHFMQISAEDGKTLWAIHGQPGQDGNHVQYIKSGAKKWSTAKGVTGTRVSCGWVVTHDGKIVKVADDGTVTEYSSSDFARDVSLGPSGRVWAITHKPHEDGGSTLSVLDPDGKGDDAWKTVAKIGARRIAAR